MARTKYTTTLGFRINNPTNIRYSAVNNWQGQTGQRGGFCTFVRPSFCYRATSLILFRYISRGWDTTEELIKHWAPSTENNTEAYITFVCKKGGFRRDTRFTRYDKNMLIMLMIAMTQIECAGYTPDRSIVELGYDLAITR